MAICLPILASTGTDDNAETFVKQGLFKPESKIENYY